jgi:hypothetical protein
LIDDERVRSSADFSAWMAGAVSLLAALPKLQTALTRRCKIHSTALVQLGVRRRPSRQQFMSAPPRGARYAGWHKNGAHTSEEMCAEWVVRRSPRVGERGDDPNDGLRGGFIPNSHYFEMIPVHGNFRRPPVRAFHFDVVTTLWVVSSLPWNWCAADIRCCGRLLRIIPLLTCP